MNRMKKILEKLEKGSPELDAGDTTVKKLESLWLIHKVKETKDGRVIYKIASAGEVYLNSLR